MRLRGSVNYVGNVDADHMSARDLTLDEGGRLMHKRM